MPRRLIFALVAVCGFLLSGGAHAAMAQGKKPLQFRDIGSVVSWQPGGDHDLYVKDAQNRWYKVHLLEPCLKLYPDQQPVFDTEIGQQTHEVESFVMFGRYQCTVTSIAPSAEPQAKP